MLRDVVKCVSSHSSISHAELLSQEGISGAAAHVAFTFREWERSPFACYS